MASGTINNFMPKISTVSVEYANIAVGSRVTANLYTLINNDKPTDATVIGVIGYQTGNNNMVINTAWYVNSSYSFSIVNLGSEAASGTANIRYMYI